MKRIVYMCLVLCMCLQGCEQDVECRYDNVPRIYFEYEYLNSQNKWAQRDSVVFSFGKLPDDVMVDTAKIVVRMLGKASDRDLAYRVKVVEKGEFLEGKTDMVAGEDYEMLKEEQVFGNHRIVDTLRIVVHREHLSASLQHPEVKTLMLRLEAGGDFQLGVDMGREMKLSLNNILFPPAWWEENLASLGFYHPKKWRKLIELDPVFAVEDEFAGMGVDMQKKSQILEGWLNNNIIIDDETGMRILKDGLVPVEE